MAEDLRTKIIDVQPTSILDVRGGFGVGMAVRFMVGSHGPYTLTLPQAEFTAAAAKAAVEKQAVEIRAVLQ